MPVSTIGECSELRANVVLYANTQIGKRCLIHSGAVLGGDGFGFATSDGTHHKIPQVGRVVIEDDVEIGANSAIDRGALAPRLRLARQAGSDSGSLSLRRRSSETS